MQVLFLDSEDTNRGSEFISSLNDDERRQLISASLPQIYQCNYEPDVSETHSQMSIAMGCLLFQMYLRPESKSGLNSLIKRIETLYIPN